MTTTDQTTTAHPDSWMLDLVAEVRGVLHAIVLSSDGLVKVRTDVTDPDTADKVAAACAGLVALGLSMGREFGTRCDRWSSSSTAASCSCAAPVTARGSR
jgi:hypothetical protein